MEEIDVRGSDAGAWCRDFQWVRECVRSMVSQGVHGEQGVSVDLVVEQPPHRRVYVFKALKEGRPDPVVTVEVASERMLLGSNPPPSYEGLTRWKPFWAEVRRGLEEGGRPAVCPNCGDGSGWVWWDTAGTWAACADCNDDEAKPRPAR